MAELEIRPAGKDDVEAMWRLARQPAVVAGTLQLPSTRLTQREQRFADLTSDDHLYVAERHGEVVGMADLHVHDRRRRHAGDLGMAVSTAHQGKGIGSALLATLIDLADNWLGLYRLELQVYTDNAAAVHVYEKHGFEVEGTLRDYAWTAGAYVDALFMARIRTEKGQAGMGSSDAAP